MPKNLTYDNARACCVPYDGPPPGLVKQIRRLAVENRPDGRASASSTPAPTPRSRWSIPTEVMLMTYDDKVAWLRRYQDSLRRERELADEVEQLHSRACKVTPALTGMPGGPSDGQSLPRAVESIVQAQQELQDQIDRCGAIRQEIAVAIGRIPSQRDQEILRRRYILGQRWEVIAVEMHYKYQHVCRCHRDAVTKLVIECDTKP